MQTPNRVLIIGLDGATWNVIDTWIRDGTLPHLAKLRKEGCWGTLASSIPPITAAAWSTFMTGKRPGKHGVFHFIKLFNENSTSVDESEIVSARSIHSAALWDIVAHHGRRVGLVNIPLTYPPRPVNGFMVTGLLTPPNASVFTYPPELSRSITDYKIDLDRFADKKPFMDAIDGDIVAPTLELVAEFRDMLEKRIRTTRQLMETNRWDFFMIVFIGTDRMGHYLWRYHHGPFNGDDQDRMLHEAVRAYYIRLDEIVGELVQRAGPDAATLVMSDHGMGPKYINRVHVNNWMRDHGWLTPVVDARNGSNPDRWLKMLGLSRDHVGRLLRRMPWAVNSKLVKKATAAAAATVDTERSKAYAIPIFNHIFGIRLNATGAEKERLREAITQALPELTIPKTGERLIRHIVQGQDYYQGPYAENVPDLIVMMDPNYAGSFRLGHYSSLVTELQAHTHRGQHRMEGIFVAHGPGVVPRAEPLPDLDIEDVAPTVLHLMGVPVPADMDGRVLTEILDPVLLEASPVRYSDPAGLWPNAAGAVFHEEAMSEEDELTIRGQLQALGYLD